MTNSLLIKVKNQTMAHMRRHQEAEMDRFIDNDIYFVINLESVI